MHLHEYIRNVRFQNVLHAQAFLYFAVICAPFDPDLRSAIFLFMRNNVVEGIAKTAIPHVGRNDDRF